jgi:hypothetical protein
MEPTIFRIRKSFLLPLGLTVLLSFVLLSSSLYLHLPKAKIVILGMFFLPACAFFAESLIRKVYLADDSIRVKKLLRSKLLKFNELTAVDTILVRKRAFLSLSSESDFIIISNSYENFGQLLQKLVAQLPADIVSDETKRLAEKPPQKGSDIFSVWLAVAVLALIIYVQLRGLF